MNTFNSKKTHEINVWSLANKEIKNQYKGKCYNSNMFIQYYIHEIEQLNNGILVKGKFMSERVICETTILSEIFKFKQIL